RRPMVTVIRPSRARCVKGTIPRHERAVLTARHPARAGRTPGTGCDGAPPGARSGLLSRVVCFAPECVAKLSLRPRANRDSVGLRGDSRESIHDGAARGWTRAILLRV